MIEKYVIRKESKYWTKQYSCFADLQHATLFDTHESAGSEIMASDDNNWQFERSTIDKVYVDK